MKQFKFDTNKLSLKINDYNINFNKNRVYESIYNLIENDYEYLNKLYPKWYDLFENIMSMADEYVEENKSVEFYNLLYSIIMEDDVLTHVSNYVNCEHTINIELDTDRSDIDNEFKFTNSFSKLLIRISIHIRLAIPILVYFNNRYIVKYGEDSKLFNDLFYSLIYKVITDINKFDPSINIFYKLNKFVLNSVTCTSYSDKTMWDYLKNLAINISILTRDIYMILLRNIIPKLEINRSVVSYIYVVIKKQIEYQFIRNFKISYKPIIFNDSEDSNSLTNPFNRIEAMLKTNEEKMFILNNNLKVFIDKNFKFEKDLLLIQDSLILNNLQVDIISMVLNRLLKIDLILYNLDKLYFLKLLLIIKNYLYTNNFKNIAIVLTCNFDAETDKKVKLKLAKAIKNNEIYKNIINNTFFGKKMDEKKTIYRFISNFLNPNYVSLYNETIEKQEIVLVDELLNFLFISSINK